MYTYWPNPKNTTFIREQYIHVSISLSDILLIITFASTSFPLNSIINLICCSFLRDIIQLLSDFWYRAPVDQMVKLLVQQKVPVYWYVMNTTVEAFNLPEWRKVPHDAEHFFLTGAPFMDTEFFPRKLRLERNMWTDNDRNMSHFFMKTYTDFARYGNPTPQQVLGLHFDVAKDGELKYLNLNTTYNSSILLNFRQTESAFWTQVCG